MDTETSEAIESLRGDVSSAETRLRTEIGRVETTLSAEIGRVETTLGAEIGRVETTLGGEIRRVETSLTAEIGNLREQVVTRDEFRGGMASMRDELKRHTQVQIETVRDDIQLLAEGFATLSAKIDRL